MTSPIAIKRQLAQLRRLDPELFAESIALIQKAPHLAGVQAAAGLKAVIKRRRGQEEEEEEEEEEAATARATALPAHVDNQDNIEDWL